MPTLVFLTHTCPFPSAMVDFYKQQGLIIQSSPCVAAYLSKKKPPLSSFESVIVSSFMSIQWLVYHNIHAKKYYCIGAQSAQALHLRRPQAQVISLEQPPYNLKNLIATHSSNLLQEECYWLGSHQGRKRYDHILKDEGSMLKSWITHWNWPLFHKKHKASFYYPEKSIVVCSSINAAISLSQLRWDTSAQLLLSSERLLKYFIGWSVLPKVSNEHWIKEIGYN